MTTASDTLPERNEEYATREYWYAPDSFVSYHNDPLVYQGPKIRTVSLPGPS